MRAVLLGMCLIMSVSVGTHALAQTTIMSEEQEYRIAFEHAHLEDMTLEQLHKQLSNANLLKDLKLSKTKIEQSADCGPHFRETQDTLDQLQSLTQRYRGRANATYQARATDLKSRNARALKAYKACFGDSIQRDEALSSHHLLTYDQHRAKFKSLEPQFQSITTLDEYIEDIETVLANQAEGPVVATMLTSFDEVLVSLDGKTGWQRVKRGEALRQGFYIKTGGRARARVQFHDHEPESNRGPTIVNIAPNSVIKLDSFVIDPKAESRRGVLDMVKGAIRAFTKGWGKRSRFSIRTGTSICGIRGTEVGIVYNPDTGVADYHLEHGDAVAEVNGREVPLQPQTSVRVQNGQISDPVPLSQQFWNNLVSMSGSGKAEDGQVNTAVSLSQQFSDNLASISGSGKSEDGSTDMIRSPNPDKKKQADNVDDAFAEEMRKLRKSFKTKPPDLSEPDFQNFREFVDWERAGWPNDPVPTFSNPLTGAAKARSLTKDVLLNLYMYDQDRLNLLIRGNFLEQIKGNTRKQSLKTFLNDSSGRPVRHQYRCAACTKNGKHCRVLADVWLGNQNGSRKMPIMFDAEDSRMTGRLDSIVEMVNASQEDVEFINRNSPEQCR